MSTDRNRNFSMLTQQSRIIFLFLFLFLSTLASQFLGKLLLPWKSRYFPGHFQTSNLISTNCTINRSVRTPCYKYVGRSQVKCKSPLLTCAAPPLLSVTILTSFSLDQSPIVSTISYTEFTGMPSYSPFALEALTCCA